jgi:endonuclease YncB( thermonuclease family)
MVCRTMRTPTPWLFALLAAGVVAVGAESACTPQERITGPISKFIDGDSFEIGTRAVRLFGVDAPEGTQPCMRDGRAWRCGDAAAAELRRLAGSRSVTCVQRDVDTYGRSVAVCRVGTTDLGAALVSAGFAVAYRRFSDDYVDEEREAQRARRGVWAGEFTAPEQYRRDEPEAEAQRDGCDIKGNINARGDKIYHTPDSSSYAETRIDEGGGERWFCTETEARAAGWRAPR